jgi:hypothetical protein
MSRAPFLKEAAPARRGLLGAAAVVAAGVAGRAIAAPLPHPDAELIATCERHPALLDAVNAETIDDGPACVPYDASLAAISAARPQTLAGIRAKAMAAKAEARWPDGSENPESSVAAHWSWDLMNDFLGLTGGAA